MPQIKFYAPAGVNSATLSDGTNLQVADNYVSADSSFALELLRAGFTPVTEDALVVTRDSSGVVILMGADGTKYAAIPLDVGGNAIANVNHRTGTLAALLALDGGVGEISVATDTKALVLHNGVAGGAVAFYRGGPSDSVFFIATASTLGAGVGVQGQLTSEKDINDLLNETSDYLNVPADAVCSLGLTATFGPEATGTYRRVVAELNIVGSTWVPVKTAEVAAAADAVVEMVIPSIGNRDASYVASKIRFKFYQDSGSAQDVVAYGHMHLVR